MKKVLFFGAALAAMSLASCSSSNDDGPQTADVPQNQTVVRGKTAVAFEAYTGRAVTRAGAAGELVTEPTTGKVDLKTQGFGVFAYYTDLKKYDQTYVPNFMYNTQVTYNDGTSKWTYSPVMYWPNEYGSSAQSDDEDKVSFFAYAPYAATTSAASGSVADATVGITGFSRNTTAGDPIVKYIASFDPTKSVDLCWGVVGSSDTSWDKIQNSATAQTMTAGKPWLDVEHPKDINQTLKFTFKHALAKLKVTIDAISDATAVADGAVIDAAETKIYVRSVSFTGIAMKGALNLNNASADKAQWLDYSGSTDLAYGEKVTVKDGRRDGREGGSGAEATNELPQGLNEAIIQKDTDTDGVTKSEVNLFKGDGTVFVIPTGEAMSVTIVYDVETKNANLPTYLSDGKTAGSSIENRITKTIDVSGAEMTLASGKSYTVKLHLGMNTVKYEASVGGWDTGDDGEGWLPSNEPAPVTP